MEKLTIFMPITRRNRIDDNMKQLANLESDSLEIKIDYLFVIDNSDISIGHVEALSKQNNLNDCSVITTNEVPPMEVNVGFRRKRIVNVLKLAAKNIPKDSSLVLMIEDDSMLQKNFLSSVMVDLKSLRKAGNKVGIVSGVQAGRWGVKMIGAWKFDDVKKPTQALTVRFRNDELFTKIDATGMYFMLTPAKLFRKARFKTNHFGPDVNYGLWVRNKGYSNYIDWSIKVGHATGSKIIEVDKNCVPILYLKNKKGLWELQNPKKKQEKTSQKKRLIS